MTRDLRELSTTADTPARDAASAGPGDVQPLIDWLIDRATYPFEMPTLLEEMFPRLVAAGLPVMRANLGFRVLHPLIRALTLTWRRGENRVEHSHFSHPPRQLEWQRSPYAKLAGAGHTSLRLSPADAARTPRTVFALPAPG